MKNITAQMGTTSMMDKNSDTLEHVLRRYVPSAVMPFLNAEEESWSSEMRRVTTLFVNLGFSEDELKSIDDQSTIQQLQVKLRRRSCTYFAHLFTHPRRTHAPTHPCSHPCRHPLTYSLTMELAHLSPQDAFMTVQDSVYMYEGTINKFLVDDKGSTLIAVFGLPPLAHENDASRGMISGESDRATNERGGRGRGGRTKEIERGKGCVYVGCAPYTLQSSHLTPDNAAPPLPPSSPFLYPTLPYPPHPVVYQGSTSAPV